MCSDCPDYENRGDAAWLHTGDGPGSNDDCAAQTARNAFEATIARTLHMRVLKEFAQLLHNYPALPLVLTESKISIPLGLPDAFAISIETDHGHYVVRFGEWRDEFALASEAVELVDAALRGELRLRIALGKTGRRYSAERRLPSGRWIALPHHEKAGELPSFNGPVHTIFLRCSFEPG